MFFFFFFQAEDGIRDGTVTGVQTCALPICARLRRARGAVEIARTRLVPPPGLGARNRRHACLAAPFRHLAVLVDPPRSEERRVGKECRCWWWRCSIVNKVLINESCETTITS